MTENEAKEILLQIAYDGEYPIGSSEAFSIAIQALEEIQRYRAMEEKLNGISVEQVVNGFINTVENQTEEPYERGRILTNSDVDMWNEYRAIGTIEELKTLKVENEELHCEIQAINATMDLLENEIRAKAIDEFVKLADECSGYTANCIEHDLALTIYTIHQIAEQMKAGGENE